MLIPTWVFFIVAGIVISAFMALRTGKMERQIELESIEKEGQVYMNRLEKEKEERKAAKERALGL